MVSRTVKVPQIQFAPSEDIVSSRDPTVAARRIFGPGRRHPCRGADAESPGPPEILQLLYIDKVVDVFVVPVQFPSAGVEKTAELPQLQCPCVQRQVPVPVVAMTGAVLGHG